MRHFYIRKAVILAVRTASLGMLVPALLALEASPNPSAPGGCTPWSVSVLSAPASC